MLLDIRAAQHVGLGPVVGDEVAGRHPGSDLECVGQVASGRQRQRALEIAGDIDGLNRLLRFEQRRPSAHGNALFHAPEREDDIESEVEPGPDFDALPRVLREARQLRDDVEDAWREVQEVVLAWSKRKGLGVMTNSVMPKPTSLRVSTAAESLMHRVGRSIRLV